METNERIQKLLEYSGLNTQQFAAKIKSKTKQAVYDMLKGRTRNISAAMADKIISAFPEVDKAWLLTGQGEMLTSDAANAPADMPAHTIRYYPNVYGLMGGAEFLDAPNEKVQPINLPGFWDCEIAINAYGDSMVPSIRSGQIVLCAEWKERYIEWGNIYLVITRGGRRCIKRVYPAADESAIECRSDNANYLPFTVPKEDIVKLYLVRGWICRETI